MCGIFGYIGSLSPQLASQCLERLRHRGPDDEGLWQEQSVTLGHRRLSILDLSNQGKQPMSYADERYWITFNGEIYNFIEIRAQLELKGHKFRSNSDTEVILGAFTEWGEKCLDKFNGMWAFAIWDRKQKSLFLSRDRFGKKPLFYSFVNGGFAFASEMKAIFPLLKEIRPNGELVRNKDKIFLYEATEDCLIKGIERFPAGHYGWFRDGKLTKTRWWNTLDNLVKVPDRYEEQVEMFRELFLDACRLRMRSDVSIGTALSGGLDSSCTIAAMAHIGQQANAQRISSDWQHAFVASFPGTPLDESHYARMVTDHLGIKATFLEIDPLRGIDRLTEYLYLFEDIYLTSPIPFMMTYEAVRENGIKVTVDGHGADELFAGYSFDYINALMDAGFNVFEAKNVLDAYYNEFRVIDLPPKYQYWYKWLKQNYREILKRKLGMYPLNSHRDQLDYLNQILYKSSHETILPTLLRNYDRYSMANGVEIRMPFMDYRIVAFAFSLPWNSKIRKGFAKSVIRDAMAKFLPHEVTYRRQKIGFNSPIVQWMKGPLKAFFLDTINSESFQHCEFINSNKVAEEIKQVIYNPDTDFSAGESAWKSLSPYLWEQAMIKTRN